MNENTRTMFIAYLKINKFTEIILKKSKENIRKNKRIIRGKLISLYKTIRLFRSKMKTIVSAITVFSIIISVISPVFIINPTKALTAEAQCSSKIDAVMAIDISSSMINGQNESKCDWMEFVSPYCEPKTASNVAENWCLSQTQGSGGPCNFPPVFTPATNSKISDTKAAVNYSFLSNLGLSDQSGLVSFGNNAILVKQLSGVHNDTQIAVNGLTTGGNTNIGEAIAEASAELGSIRANAIAEKIIILLTDGKANRPNGVGDPEIYAENKARDAADLGYKIYTIGLGSDINETMLGNIAAISGGIYYHAFTGSELAGIYDTVYDEISTHECVPASISGYKYDDKDNDGIDEDDGVLSGWEIILSGEDKSDATTTDENGYFTFSGLMPGNYTVSEGENSDKGVFIQTVPENNSYAITLSEGEDKAGNNFANYFPACGNSILDDFDGYTELCDDGILNGIYGYCNNKCSGQTPSMCGNGAREGDEACDGFDGVAEHQTCSDQCSVINIPYCGDSVKNGDEQCDGAEGISANQSCTDSCTIVNLDFCGDNIKNGNEECDDTDGVGENQSCSDQCSIIDLPYCGDGIVNGNDQCDDGNTNDGDGCSVTCETEEESQQSVCGNGLKESGEGCDGTDGVGEHQSCSNECTIINNPYCGDSIVNGNETCDDSNATNGDGCSSACEIEESDDNRNDGDNSGDNSSNDGRGSVSVVQFSISDESLRLSNIEEDSVTISWLTSHFASSQVIYSLEGEKHTLNLNDNLGGPPKYGYAHTTREYDTNPKVTGHSVAITGLTPGNKYYYRTVSRGSFAVSQEQSFTLPAFSKDNKNIFSKETENSEDKGEVKGVESMFESAPENCKYLSEFISFGARNDLEEAKKLEKFLNDFENENLAINGMFEKADSEAVSRFQQKFASEILEPWSLKESTGNVFITTKNKIDEIYCHKEIPLSREQLIEIKRIIAKTQNQPDLTSQINQNNPDTIVNDDAIVESGEVKGAEADSVSDGNIETLIKDDAIKEEDDDESNDNKNVEKANTDNETISSGFDSAYALIVIFVIAFSAYIYFQSRKKKENN